LAQVFGLARAIALIVLQLKLFFSSDKRDGLVVPERFVACGFLQVQQHVEQGIGVVAAGARRRTRRLRRRLRREGERRRFRDVVTDVLGVEVLELAVVWGPPGPGLCDECCRVCPGIPGQNLGSLCCICNNLVFG